MNQIHGHQQFAGLERRGAETGCTGLRATRLRNKSNRGRRRIIRQLRRPHTSSSLCLQLLELGNHAQRIGTSDIRIGRFGLETRNGLPSIEQMVKKTGDLDRLSRDANPKQSWKWPPAFA